jgi:hypothetical protein
MTLISTNAKSGKQICVFVPKNESFGAVCCEMESFSAFQNQLAVPLIPDSAGKRTASAPFS